MNTGGDIGDGKLSGGVSVAAKETSADLSTPAWLVQTSADCRVPLVWAGYQSSRRVLMSAHTLRGSVLSTPHCRATGYTHLLPS